MCIRADSKIGGLAKAATLPLAPMNGFAAFVKSQKSNARIVPIWRPKVNLVRYADDFIITGDSQELLQNEVRPLVEQFLQERGLALSADKPRITHIDEGFDFLGQISANTMASH